jgi:hypothetical protein
LHEVLHGVGVPTVRGAIDLAMEREEASDEGR